MISRNFHNFSYLFFQGKTKQGQFALDTSVKSITYYKDFFGVSYPLPKYDCIAIADFQSGAMENWGLVTFRETAVLVDPTNTSQKTADFTKKSLISSSLAEEKTNLIY